MRILLANDGFGDAGGVQNYLDAITDGLLRRGHALALLHRDAAPAPFAGRATSALPQFSTATEGVGAAIDRVAAWAPDVCFSHNMNLLEIDRALIARWPVIKFMHGYFGTCIGGQKRFGFPVVQPCDRRFGVACLALYGPRHCGELSVSAFVGHYQWAREQHALLPSYHTIVVASEHMKREFDRNGVHPSQIQVNPLFSTHTEPPVARPPTTSAPRAWTVAFAGRMTVLKGGDLLVDAAAAAASRLGRSLELLLIGDGPQRRAWEERAATRGVPCTSPGWLNDSERWRVLSKATLLALPSSWPEPFGLVGLEAGALGIPAVAFDVGGIREWLRPGVNGWLAAADPPRSESFAAALVDALSDETRLAAMGAGAIEVAREMSLGHHLDALDSIFFASVGDHAHSAGR
jgi:glycosyltransferase involved in cell wall biosynthesis